jgi:hypothetical protein
MRALEDAKRPGDKITGDRAAAGRDGWRDPGESRPSMSGLRGLSCVCSSRYRRGVAAKSHQNGDVRKPSVNQPAKAPMFGYVNVA